uniref:Ecdysone receptor n=2 Tax=Panonychus citri TaxID=50023 RepID=A0A2H4LHN3_PANCT|nr:ecdysone receptor [Panonychus citri]
MILNSNNMSPCSLQPIVRKRSALQVTPGSSTLNCGSIVESSPEVSSSQTGTGISPVPSLNSSEIGEVDLDFWDLDINESSSISHSSGKEDMSPPNSVNGYNSADSFGDPKKKKGPAPRQQEELCLVCGDRASGYHYNALTCEGCKGFFRRSITKNAVYQCKYGNNCDIDMYMRRKCQECRLKKCLNVGMRPECVVPEYQCAIKRESKRAQKEKDKPNSTTKDASPDKEDKTLVLSGTKTPTTSPTLAPNEIKKLTPQQEEIIKQLVYYQDIHESPSEADVKSVTPFPLGETEDDNIKRFQHMAEMTILTVQLIVEFSKRVPGFDTLLREDQITLLKSCSSEVMMLRSSRKYDIKTDSIVYANNQPYTRENYFSASVGVATNQIFGFCRHMCLLKVDNAEYALLNAIVIFSERPQLIEPKKVEKIQDFYIDTLKCYIENRRPPSKCYFAKLLATLVELRTLGSMNSEICFSLKVQNRKLPPFLAEIWDIQE